MAEAGGGSQASTSVGPALNVAYRCKEACGIRAGPVQNADGSYSVGADDLFVLPPNTKEIVYSNNGNLFLTLLADSVVVWSCETFELLSSISRRGIVAAAFSPLGTFIQTWEKVSDSSNSAGGNLQIWLVATGQRVGALNVGGVFSKENWPVLQWSRDEVVAARMAPDSVVFFDGTAIDRGVVRSLAVPSITRFSMSPSLPYRFATFVPEKKGNPSLFSIYDYPSCDAPICSRTHFRASYADFFWSPKGDSLLIKTSVDVDVTGQSYYGGSDIFFMNAARTASMLAGVESPVYDCAWDPKGSEFVVVFGHMPSRALLFDSQSRAVFDFGTGSRNRVIFSPHGRFLMLAGFGNVAGAMEFWDKNKKKLIGSATMPATSPVGWSPCSRYFICATLWPRLRVDNGYNVIKYDGSVVFRHRHPTEFYAVSFRPAASGVYPDRPASPSAESCAGGAASAAVVAKPAAYVPPHLRGVAAPAVQKLHNYEPPKKIDTAVQMRWRPDDASKGPLLPPGAEVLDAPSSKAPGEISKSALKKQKQKLKEAARAELSNALDQVKALNMGAGSASVAVEEEVDWPKRLKAVQKKLRQLDDLREAQHAGQMLNADQLLKLQSQAALEEEQQLISSKMKEL